MLLPRELQEITLLIDLNKECLIQLHSQFPTIKSGFLQKTNDIIILSEGIYDSVVYRVDLESKLKDLASDYHSYSIISKAGYDEENLYCAHSWVDVGFRFTKMVCKHCNKDQ